MISHLQNKRITSRNRLRLGSIIGVFVVLLVLFVVYRHQTSGFVQRIVTPIWEMKQSIFSSEGTLASLIESRKQLLEENAALQAEIDRSNDELTEARVIAKENAELKGLMGRKTEEKTVLAAVLARPSLSPYGSLFIDVGAKQNISEGALVVVHGITPIGTIAEVFESSSRVLLFSAAGVETESFIDAETHLPVKVEGQGGGNYMAEIPRAAKVDGGDAVSLPGIVARVLGVVERIEADETDSFKKLFFKVPTNINTLRFVEVVL